MGPVIQVGGLVYHSRLAVQPSDLGAGAPAAPPFLPRAAARPRGRGRKPGQALAAGPLCPTSAPRVHLQIRPVPPFHEGGTQHRREGRTRGRRVR